MKTFTTIAIAFLFLATTGCQKEHAKYRFTPKFHKYQQVQFEKSIQHDFAENGKRIWDIPQPLTIDSFYYNSTWRDNWYFVTDASGHKRESAIDELQLQEWKGSLQK